MKWQMSVTIVQERERVRSCERERVTAYDHHMKRERLKLKAEKKQTNDDDNNDDDDDSEKCEQTYTLARRSLAPNTHAN